MNEEFKNFQSAHFFCYSFKLYHFLKAHGVRYVSKGKNANNGLSYWVFERNEQLGDLLGKWEAFKAEKTK